MKLYYFIYFLVSKFSSDRNCILNKFYSIYCIHVSRMKNSHKESVVQQQRFKIRKRKGDVTDRSDNIAEGSKIRSKCVRNGRRIFPKVVTKRQAAIVHAIFLLSRRVRLAECQAGHDPDDVAERWKRTWENTYLTMLMLPGTTAGRNYWSRGNSVAPAIKNDRRRPLSLFPFMNKHANIRIHREERAEGR